MKEKGTLLVVGSLLASSLVTVIPTRVAGTLDFTGEIINESCQVANNGNDVNADFGNVDMSALKSHEAKITETPFTINLTNRPLVQSTSISLEGIPDINANGTSAAVLALFDAVDTAKGVGIEVFSSPDSPTEGIQLASDKQSKTAASQADENGDIIFNFIADLKNDSFPDVTADNINATANINIAYEQNVLIAAFIEGGIPRPYFHPPWPDPQLYSIMKWLFS